MESFEVLAAAELALPGMTRRVMFGRDTLLADAQIPTPSATATGWR